MEVSLIGVVREAGKGMELSSGWLFWIVEGIIAEVDGLMKVGTDKFEEHRPMVEGETKIQLYL